MSKLQLKQQMSRSFLIQRLKTPVKQVSNPYSFGVSGRGSFPQEVRQLLKDVFSFDYMGAAEFEYGAVEVALAFVFKQATENNLVSGTHQDPVGSVFYICPKPYQEKVVSTIESLLEDENQLRLQEFCGLKNALTRDQSDNPWRVVGWLELNNGFFFFVDQIMFEAMKNVLAVDDK